MKTLMHTNTSSKTTHNIKTSHKTMLYMLWMPQCVADTASMCLYCYSADTVTLICMLYTTCSMFRAWPVYISLLYHAQIMQLLNHVLLTLNKSNILSNTLKSFKHILFKKLNSFNMTCFQTILHNLNPNLKT
jgi:hypothetical protein